MGGKGSILNVLETVTDINTKKRDDGISEVVAAHPGVEIIQTISDMTQVSEATVKIQSALAARMDEIDGIITTGYNPTIAAASVLTEWHKDPKHKKDPLHRHRHRRDRPAGHPRRATSTPRSPRTRPATAIFPACS